MFEIEEYLFEFSKIAQVRGNFQETHKIYVFLTFVPLTDPIKRTTAKKITPVERENISLGSVFLRFFISHLILEKKKKMYLQFEHFFMM